MHLIIINGQTATGKTTVARQLAKDLNLPLHLTDEWKETQVFDAYPSKPTIRQLYKAEQESREKLFQVIAKAIATHEDTIVEGLFLSSHRKRLRKLLSPDTEVIELFFYSTGFISYHRYVDRYKSGERHQSHRDNLVYWVPWVEAASERLGWRWLKPMELGPSLLRVDATDFNSVDYPKIRDYVAKHLRT